MTTDGAITGAATADPPRCDECGYNLTGLGPGGRCPECGREIARALRDPSLAAADPQWTKRVRAGLAVTVAAYLVYALAGFTIRIAPPRTYDVMVFWMAGLLEFLGVWWVSAPEPDVGRMREHSWVRRTLRTTAIIA